MAKSKQPKTPKTCWYFRFSDAATIEVGQVISRGKAPNAVDLTIFKELGLFGPFETQEEALNAAAVALEVQYRKALEQDFLQSQSQSQSITRGEVNAESKFIN